MTKVTAIALMHQVNQLPTSAKSDTAKLDFWLHGANIIIGSNFLAYSIPMNGEVGTEDYINNHLKRDTYHLNVQRIVGVTTRDVVNDRFNDRFVERSIKGYHSAAKQVQKVLQAEHETQASETEFQLYTFKNGFVYLYSTKEAQLSGFSQDAIIRATNLELDPVETNTKIDIIDFDANPMLRPGGAPKNEEAALDFFHDRAPHNFEAVTQYFQANFDGVTANRILDSLRAHFTANEPQFAELFDFTNGAMLVAFGPDQPDPNRVNLYFWNNSVQEVHDYDKYTPQDITNFFKVELHNLSDNESTFFAIQSTSYWIFLINQADMRFFIYSPDPIHDFQDVDLTPTLKKLA